MLVIGLTGGIGSGKSTVADLFANRGIAVIDTDQLARDVTKIGQPALDKIKIKFGPEILNQDGSLNRGALRTIIFNDDLQRKWLEQLLHPLIRAELKRQVQSAQSPYCIAVIPLLLETEPNPLIDRILVVDTEEEQQIKRTQTRDKTSYEEVKAIIDTQINRLNRLKLADDVIENNGSLTDLNKQVERLHNNYLSLAKFNELS